MAKQWARNGPSTLFGLMDSNFPNMFLSGPWQIGFSINYLFNMDVLAKQAAYILTTALKIADGGTDSVTVEAPSDGATFWARQLLIHSKASSVIFGCHSHLIEPDADIKKLPEPVIKKAAQYAVWGKGIEDFSRIMEEWREDGRMMGIRVRWNGPNSV